MKRIVVYQAEDGTRYLTRKDAQRHEEALTQLRAMKNIVSIAAGFARIRARYDQTKALSDISQAGVVISVLRRLLDMPKTIESRRAIARSLFTIAKEAK